MSALPPNVVDLRSDTVTRPTPEMYKAMERAPLGDDVLGDDPTVLELERVAAQRVGKEAAVFVPSGTMGNQIAIAASIERGDSILCEEESHVVYYECGAPAIVGGGVTLTIPSVRGVMDPSEVARRVIHRTYHSPGSTLLCLENTHNRGGGTILPVETMRAYRSIADANGMRIHMDGARIFNAAVGADTDVRSWTDQVDSVMFCLSKGLGSPVGSILAGDEDMVARSRQWRKRLGGGMRQAGVLAACGLVSLRTMVDRLAEDHRRAKETALALSVVEGLQINLESVETNMVLIGTEGSAEDWLSMVRECGVWALAPAHDRIRLVFHKDVDDEGAGRAIKAFERASSAMKAAS